MIKQNYYKSKKYDININIYKTQNEFVVLRKIDVWITQILMKDKKVQKNQMILQKTISIEKKKKRKKYIWLNFWQNMCVAISWL